MVPGGVTPMRAKFGFRTRFRLTRRYRGWLPLRRALFHRRLRLMRYCAACPSCWPGTDRNNPLIVRVSYAVPA